MVKENKRIIPMWGNGIILAGLTYMIDVVTQIVIGIPSPALWAGYAGSAAVIAGGLYLEKNAKREHEIQAVVGNEGIEVISENKRNYGIEMNLTLPKGMSTNDFENRKLALEQYFNGEVIISYKNKSVNLKVKTNALEPTYKFDLIHTAKPVELVAGYSRDGLLTLDMEKAVHLLVAGETGSGKSVALRQILTSLILTKPDLQMNLVDFKRVELGIFKKASNVKHFCTSPEEFESVLDELAAESEKRYTMFEEHNLVNIQSWNKKYTPLPYMLTVIDEFATLQHEKEIMKKLTRRLEKDRACGIHYIIATQHPSSKIICGEIKANIPSILCFKVANQINSRTVIDENGAELLSGSGAGILKAFGKTQHIQTMFLSETQAQKLIRPKVTEAKCEVKPHDNATGRGTVWTNLKV